MIVIFLEIEAVYICFPLTFINNKLHSYTWTCDMKKLEPTNNKPPSPIDTFDHSRTNVKLCCGLYYPQHNEQKC
jgi:hypothetical protein